MRALDVLKTPAKRLVTIDFETYYAPDYTLSKMTTAEYIRDPRFQTIGVGLRQGAKQTWLEHDEFKKLAATVDWSQFAILCHHAHFDGLILGHHYGVRPGFWLDTLSMARGRFGTEVGGSLSKLAQHYGLGEKGHEVVLALGKRREDFTPADWKRYGEYCKNDCFLTEGIFGNLLPETTELELHAIDARIRMYAEPRITVNDDLLAKAFAWEQKKKADLLAQAEMNKEVLMSDNKFALALQGMGVDPPRKMSGRTGEETWAFAKTDPGMQEMLESDIDEVRWLAEARIGLKSTINENRIERLRRIAKGSTLPIYLKYCGAHTGRDSGGDKINPQNFQKPDPKRPYSGAIREALQAPAGEVIVEVDSGQIEARGTAWLAGHDELLEVFRLQNSGLGQDVYSKFASEVYGRRIWFKTEKNQKIAPEDKVPRQVGKICVLGLGFGMGWRKFSAMTLGRPLGGDPVQFGPAEAELLGVDVPEFQSRTEDAWKIPSRLPDDQLLVHCAVAKAIVDRYRRINAPITKLWKEAQRVIEVMEGLEEGKSIPWGPGGRFCIERHRLKLPSGRFLRYPGLKLDDGEASYMGGRAGKERVRFYGGLFVENIVQAFCRDIVFEQALYLQGKFGYRSFLMTHDSDAFTAPEAEGQLALDRALEVFRTSPGWCPEIPLSADGGFGKTYGDAK